MIPELLTTQKNWVIWHRELRGENWTKVPYQGKNPDRKAESNNPETWTDYKTVSMITHKNKTGIGYCFDGQGIYGIDLDGAINPDGSVYPPFNPILEKMRTYTEISPSGAGLHIILQCDEEPYPSGKSKQWIDGTIKREVGLFGKGKYFTMTDKAYGEVSSLEKFTAQEIRALLDTFLIPEKEKQPAPAPVKQPAPANLTDDEIISLCHHAKNGNKFYDLFDKGLTTGYPSASEADSALASMLAFYTTDTTQIQRIMERSYLVREKYHRDGYLESTARHASDIQKEHYKPREQVEPLPEISDKDIEARRREFRRTVPDFPEECLTGFFKEYMDYGKSISYAVSDFHFGAILAVVSSAIGRKVVMRSASGKLYCNVFVIATGLSSVSGKTTACNTATSEFTLIEQEEVCQFLAKKNSPQSLIQQLDKIHNRLWYYDECGEFFEDIKNKWASALISVMCSLYDGSPVSYSLSEAGGKNKPHEWNAKDGFLSCLWNTTPTEIERYADWKNFANGFLPRFMWFSSTRSNEPTKNRALNDEDIRKKTAIEHQIQELRKAMSGIPGNDNVIFEPSDIIEQWKIDNIKSHDGPEHEKYRISSSRLVGHAYKIAMIMTLMDSDTQKKIYGKIFKEKFPKHFSIPDNYARVAVKIAQDYLLPRILEVAEMCEASQTKSGQDIILKVLKKHEGVCSRSMLLQCTRIKSRVMTELLETMVEADLIIRRTEKSKTKEGEIILLKSLSVSKDSNNTKDS